MVLVCAARSSDRDAARFNVERIRTSDDIIISAQGRALLASAGPSGKTCHERQAVVTGVLHDCSSDNSL